MIPGSEESYKRTELPNGAFTLNPYALNRRMPDPYGPLPLTGREVSQDDLPKVIELIGQAFQQFSQKLAAPFN